MRSIILVAVPSFAAIIGFFWFWKKRKPPGICDKKGKSEGITVSSTTEDNSVIECENKVSNDDIQCGLLVTDTVSRDHFAGVPSTKGISESELMDDVLNTSVSSTLEKSGGELSIADDSTDSVVVIITENKIKSCKSRGECAGNTCSEGISSCEQQSATNVVANIDDEDLPTEVIEEITVSESHSVCSMPSSMDLNSVPSHTDVSSVSSHTDVSNVSSHTDFSSIPSSTDLLSVSSHTDVSSTPSHTDVGNVSSCTDVSNVPSHTDVSSIPSHLDISNVSSHTDVSNVPSHTDVSSVWSSTEISSVPSSTEVNGVQSSTDGGLEVTVTDEFQTNDSPISDSPAPEILSSENLKSFDFSLKKDQGKQGSFNDVNGNTSTEVEQEVAEVTGSLHCSKSHSSAVGSPVENASVTSSNGSGSDVPSEASGDSGRGASLADIGSPASLDTAIPGSIIYEFDFPSPLCGKLIGKSGRNINTVKEQCGADISVQRHPFTPDLQIVRLEGSKRQVFCALDLVKQRFPPHKFNISYAPLEEQRLPDPYPILPAEMMQLNLPEGCTVDVIVSSVVTPNHVFLQQLTHPTFPMLERQSHCMLLCYTQDTIVPQLPRPIEVGTVCAAPMFNGWYRAQIVEVYPDADEVYIRFVDYGGYLRLQACLLRQIRSDFTSLPFQATECYLSNVVPPGDDDDFGVEASVLMEQMVHGKVLQVQVMGFEGDSTPYVEMYLPQPDRSVLFVNRELVNQGVARWLENPV